MYPRALIAGGGAPEIQMSTELAAYSQVGTRGNGMDMQSCRGLAGFRTIFNVRASKSGAKFTQLC
jgi:hypothetical protein